MTLPARKALRRLYGISWDEFRTRLSQEVGKRGEYALYRAGITFRQERLLSDPTPGGNFFFSPEELNGRLALLKQHLPSLVEATIEEANEILEHRFRLLGYRDLDYGPDIDWHLDAVHGQRAPLEAWYKIHFLNFNEVGDHKVIWELNRHQHLVTLAKAQALTGDDKYVEELARQFYSWQAANPYPMGINWGSSLEVAFRSLSWLWVRNLVATSPALPDCFERDLLHGLSQNGRYIERYLSTYFSPNTHLIGEAVALFFIGTLCPQIPAANRWRQKGLAIVLGESTRQVRADGVYFEQSLYYHVYALDFFLHARVLALRNGIEVPESFDAVLQRMLEVVRVLCRDGSPEGFGDDDGGRLFSPPRNRAEHMSDPLALGAALFKSTGLRELATITEEAIWLFGDHAVSQTALDPLPATVSPAAFPDGGLYLMASAGQQMLIDAGPQGAGRSGHGHADALSVTLSVRGRRWLRDSGSYVYVTPDHEREARNWFRGTAAHSTLQVDKLDQAIAHGPFSWSSLPEVCAQQWIPGSRFSLFLGSHSGYRRLPDPVVHRRTIFHLHGEYWLVRDVAEGQEVHELDVRWHFAPELNVVASENGLTATCDEEEGLVLLVAASAEWDWAVEEGLVSPAYGVKQSAPVGTFRTRVQLPAELGTLLVPLPAGERAGNFMLATASSEAIAYSYEQDELVDNAVFGKPFSTWTCAPFRSDAAFLFARSERREITLLVFCSATFVELNGQRVFSSPQIVERFEWSRADGASASNQEALAVFDEEMLRSRTAVP